MHKTDSIERAVKEIERINRESLGRDEDWRDFVRLVIYRTIEEYNREAKLRKVKA